MKKFELYNKIKDIISYTNKYLLSSFPKVHIVLKIKLQDNLYSLLENCIKANINAKNIRNKYQKEMLTNTYLLDYYIEEIMLQKIINAKKYQAFIKKLNVINMMIIGWLNSEKTF